MSLVKKKYPSNILIFDGKIKLQKKNNLMFNKTIAQDPVKDVIIKLDNEHCDMPGWYYNCSTGDIHSQLSKVSPRKDFFILDLNEESTYELFYETVYCPKADAVMIKVYRLSRSATRISNEKRYNEMKPIKPVLSKIVLITKDQQVYNSVMPSCDFHMVSTASIPESMHMRPLRLYSDIKKNNTSGDPVFRRTMANLFQPICPIKGNSICKWDSFEDIERLFHRTQYSTETWSKKDKEKVNKLCSVINPDEQKYKKTSVQYNNFSVVERLEEFKNTCVVRNFYRYEDGIFEISRIFVDEKESFTCYKNYDGEWYHKTYKEEDQANIWNFAIEDFSAEVVKGTKMQYYISIITEIPVENRCAVLNAFLQEDLFEKLYKIGFNNYVKNLLKGARKPRRILEDELLVNWNENSVHGFLGLNNHQIEVIKQELNSLSEREVSEYPLWHSAGLSMEGFLSHKFSLVRAAKDILTKDHPFFNESQPNIFKINNIDNNTFDKVWEFLQELKEISKHHIPGCFTNSVLRVLASKAIPCAYYIHHLYGLDIMVSMLPTLLDIIKLDIKMLSNPSIIWNEYGYSALSIQLYKDYLCCVDSVGDPVHFKPYLPEVSFEAISVVHKNMTEYTNALDAKNMYRIADMNNWNKRKEIWIPWLYCNEKYSVIYPETPAELIIEGNTLKHCVAGYVKTVSEGNTNILFIRKKEELDKPFFTVEITNNGVIGQVHGFANRNASTEPGLELFIKEWIGSKKLMASNYDKCQ